MKRTYTKEELQALHRELYDILRETIRVCEEHDIRYFLIGGTAIGALYDQAILPWDDDIDIGMTRDQYNRFLEVAPTALGQQYFLSYYETDPKTPYYFAKVRKNGTLFKEETFSEIAMHQGIFIDVFPFDKIPDNALLQKAHRGVVNFLKCCLLGTEIWMWKYFGTPKVEHPSNRNILACFLTRVVCSLVPKKYIYKAMVKAQSAFNGSCATYYNNTTTKTDKIEVQATIDLVKVPFGPLKVAVTRELEHFLRFNFPKLHRFNEAEQAQISNHCPQELVFSPNNEELPVK